jgi:hypothetical protein
MGSPAAPYVLRERRKYELADTCFSVSVANSIRPYVGDIKN